MRNRTLTIMGALLLAAAPIQAQDEYELYVADAPQRVSVLSLKRQPQNAILKGMGLELRQITDGFVYEQFELADQTGMVVENALANLPAHKAGVRWHDVIAKVDGKPISSVDDLVAAYNGCKADEVLVEIIQKGKKKTVKIDKSEVGKWAKDFRIGVHVQPVPNELAVHLGLSSDAKQGLYISSVVEKSPAEKAGLKEGDILLKANETPLPTSDVLNNLVRESQGREMNLEIVQAGKKLQLKLAAAEQVNDPRLTEIQVGRITDAINLQSVILRDYNADLSTQNTARTEAATLERLLKAVEQLTKEVGELREELKKK